MKTFTSSDFQVIRDFFTDAEWDAIDSAMADYQDYGDRDSDLMNSVADKIQLLFNPKYQDENRHPESGGN